MLLIRLLKKLFLELEECPKCHRGFLTQRRDLVNRKGESEREGLDAYRFWDECIYDVYRACNRCDYRKFIKRIISIENSYIDGM